jgi:hypothetical protein
MGIAGIAGGNGIDTGCEIVDIQLAGSLITNLQAWAQGIVWAADPFGSYHCQVISISMSTPNYSETLRAAIRFAHSVGVSIVCPNGNSTTPPLLYPAGFSDAWVTAVGAYDTSGVNIYTSGVGSSVDILAPGERCPTTTVPGFADTNQIYQQQILDLFSATSCATPHVAGSIALLRTYLGNSLNPEDYEWILKCSADDTNGDGNPQTWDEDYGHGQLRIGNALTIASNWSINTYATPTTSVVDSAFVEVQFTSGPYTTLTPAIRYTVVGTLIYRGDFSSTPYVWGTTEKPYPSGYHGFSMESPNYGEPFHEVITSSITHGSCCAKTYIYKMWNDQLSEYSEWYPAQPSQIPVAIVAMGPTTTKMALTSYNQKEPVIASIPNPFNATVEVSFTVLESGTLLVDVFNLRGQKVCQLFDDDVAAGPMTLRWHGMHDNGRPAASGTYILRVKSGKKTAVHKITLAK